MGVAILNLRFGNALVVIAIFGTLRRLIGKALHFWAVPCFF